MNKYIPIVIFCFLATIGFLAYSIQKGVRLKKQNRGPDFVETTVMAGGNEVSVFIPKEGLNLDLENLLNAAQRQFNKTNQVSSNTHP
jgi:hypothetical protein